jgi:hypothetical protein
MEPKPYSLTCLYTAGVPKVDFDLIEAAINNDPNLSDMSPTIVTRLPAKLVSFDFNGQFSIQILIGQQPLAAKTFAIALMGAKATTVENDYARVVSQHRGYLTVTVDPEDTVKETLEQRLRRVYALQMVTEFLYMFAKPDLLYSDMAKSLVYPSLSPRSYRGELDRRIFEQAVLFSRRSQVGDGGPIGANVWGSEELLGKPVFFPTVDFPSWAVTAGSTWFVAHCDLHGIPDKDETFRDSQGHAVYLFEDTKPTVNYPLGTYKVTIQSNSLAQERGQDGKPRHPELLSPENKQNRANEEKHAPKRSVERSPLYSFMVLLIGIGFAYGLVVLSLYWRA